MASGKPVLMALKRCEICSIAVVPEHPSLQKLKTQTQIASEYFEINDIMEGSEINRLGAH
jgi:hypothetical protein